MGNSDVSIGADGNYFRSPSFFRYTSLASLSPEELCGVTVESAGYQVGWSHGKEKVEGDKFDVSKGSYYANPLVEDLLQSIIERRRVARSTDSNSGGMEEYEAPEDDLERVSLANPAFFAQNVWPTESIPELEAAIKDMGRLICKVGRLLAKLCDKYVSTKVSRLSGFQLHV